MGWKIYFGVFLFLLVISYINVFKTLGPAPIYVLDLLVSFMSLPGLYCFAFKKRWLLAKFWKIYFIVFLAWDLAFNLIITPMIEAKHSMVDSVIGLAITIPLYIALYLYAFKFLDPKKTIQ